LGQSLCQLNRPNEGIPFLDKAGKVLLKEAKLTRETKYPLDLAYQLFIGIAKEALILANAILGIDADSANANYIASLSLQALNRLPEAYSFAIRAVKLAPSESNAIIHLAALESKLGNLVDARERLEFVVSKLGDANAARANLELGVILDKEGEFDLAFKHLTEAGKIIWMPLQFARWIKALCIAILVNTKRHSMRNFYNPAPIGWLMMAYHPGVFNCFTAPALHLRTNSCCTQSGFKQR